MTTESKKPLKLFYCYAREDKAFRDALDNHLSPLKYQNQIISWSDREISPGTDWAKEIDTHLNTAHIILLLISADFMASKYCYGVEMKRALERHHAGTARVIPIILRRTFWEEAPFSTLQVLPTDAKPITHWQDRDEAFWDITHGIRKAILDLHVLLKTKQEWFDEGIALSSLKRHQEAIAAYEQAIRLDPNDAQAYYGKGVSLYHLKRYQEALAALEQAIRLDPNLAYAYSLKGNTLFELKRHQEALAAYEQAIRLDPNDAQAYYGKGNALAQLKKPKEAWQCYEKARQLGYSR